MHDYTGRLYFVIALPRSRTAWMCKFFSRYAVTWHDPLKNCESIDELGAKVDNALFNTNVRASKIMIADTAGLFFMQEIVARFPGARFIVIERHFREVCESLRREGVFSLISMSSALGYFKQWQYILPEKDTMCVLFERINIDLGTMAVFLGVTAGKWDADSWRAWKEHMIHTNVQIPFTRQHAQTNWPKVRKLLRGKFSFRNDSRLRGESR